MLTFYYNGIKENGGALQTCWYSNGKLKNYPAGTITIYKREYSKFSAGIHQAFSVTNDTDSMTDYFDKDTIRVMPDHPLYAQVNAALEKNAARNAKRYAKAA